jgi:PAS domain S-box-containing protein
MDDKLSPTSHLAYDPVENAALRRELQATRQRLEAAEAELHALRAEHDRLCGASRKGNRRLAAADKALAAANEASSNETEAALRERERRLAAELDTVQRLQQVSTQLIGADGIDALYGQILDTGMALLQADCASLQVLHPERGTEGKLELVGYRGFSAQAAKFWQWVSPASPRTCGMVLRTGRRVAVSDVRASEFMAGSADQATYLQTGIHAVQTTPLLSRSGALLGMFSTHWREPHELTPRELSALDVLARQVADLIDRKQAEEALRRSQATLNAVLDALPVGLVIAEPDGKIVRVNAAIKAMWGLPPETRHWEQYGEWIAYWPETGARIQAHEWAMARALRQAKTVVGELIEYQPFGSRQRRFMLNNAAPIRDATGKVIGGVVAALDVTERLAAERALRESEARFRAMADGLPLIVWVHDAAGRQEFVNHTFCEFFGVTPEQAAGEPWQLLMHPEDGAYIDEFLACVRERRPFHAEARVCNAAGEWRYIESWGRPRFSASGEFLGFAGTSADITARKRLEQLKEEFVSTVNHELRTPLTSIVGALGLVQGGALGEPPAQIKEMCGIAHRNAARLVRLVNDLLDLDKLASGKMPFNIQQVSLAPLTEEVLATMRPYAEQFNVALAIRIEAPGAMVQADPDRLNQVLTNLLSNAVKFSPQGEAVTVGISGHQGSVRLTVTDRGPGIPETFRDRMFEKFFQVDASDSRAKGGTGLGLSICKAIIDRLGGRIGFESQVRRGTTFWFELPVGLDEPHNG